MLNPDDTAILRKIVTGVAASVLLIAIGIWLYSTGKLGYVGLNPAAALWIGFIIIFVMLAALAFGVFVLKHSNSNENGGDAPSMLDHIEARTLRNIVIGAGVLVMGTFGWAGTFIFWKGQDSEISLPIVIIAGVTVLLLVLGLVTVVFSILKLSNKEEALGLPSGSVRAVIALMLLVIFAIVAIFLYSDVSSNGRLQKVEKVTAEQEIEYRKNVDVAFTLPEPKDAANPNAKETRTLFYRSSGSRAAEDLAKQLIVLLGTLVTAVSSFYFGSASTAAATKQAGGTGGPNAIIVTPSNFKPGGDPQPITIGGGNLSKVGLVKLTKEGKGPIIADTGTIVATETSVNCKIAVPKDADFGPWDVVVSDNANNFSTVPGSVTIGSASTPAPQEPPKVPELKANDALQDLKVDAPDVPANVRSVKLTLGSDTLTAQDGSAKKTETGVSCKIVIPATAKKDQWDIVVIAADGTQTTLKDKKIKIVSA